MQTVTVICRLHGHVKRVEQFQRALGVRTAQDGRLLIVDYLKSRPYPGSPLGCSIFPWPWQVYIETLEGWYEHQD